jgi:hypothetical protein
MFNDASPLFYFSTEFFQHNAFGFIILNGVYVAGIVLPWAYFIIKGFIHFYNTH